MLRSLLLSVVSSKSMQQPSTIHLAFVDAYPKEITDESLSFISSYTRNSNLGELREHVEKVKETMTSQVICVAFILWDSYMSLQLHVYRCIEHNAFLYPRICKMHTQVYEKAKQAWEASYSSHTRFKYGDQSLLTAPPLFMIPSSNRT